MGPCTRAIGQCAPPLDAKRNVKTWLSQFGFLFLQQLGLQDVFGACNINANGREKCGRSEVDMRNLTGFPHNFWQTQVPLTQVASGKRVTVALVWRVVQLLSLYRRSKQRFMISVEEYGGNNKSRREHGCTCSTLLLTGELLCLLCLNNCPWRGTYYY